MNDDLQTDRIFAIWTASVSSCRARIRRSKSPMYRHTDEAQTTLSFCFAETTLMLWSGRGIELAESAAIESGPLRFGVPSVA